MKRRILALVLLFVLLSLTSCSRTREVERRMSTAVLQEATLDQLVQSVNSNASRLQTLVANIDIDTSVGGKKKGKITEYEQIAGILLVRKPQMMHMIGLLPVVRNKVVDMVSDGQTFRLSFPTKNKFVVGSNQVVRVSDQPLENWRPQHIFDALFVKEIDAQNEQAVLEQSIEMVKDPATHKDLEQSDYVVIVIRKEGDKAYLSRKIIFSRTDLRPHAQMIYDAEGQLVTDAHYESYIDYGGGILFPSVIQIVRPVEEYGIKLTLKMPRFNEKLLDDKFVLTQPPGSQLVNMDDKSSAAQGHPPIANSDPNKKPVQ
jgi:outer membrane lipoprotein-sorting protein